ncbi:hypothetical protein BAOM_2939 [Peribacillus asahii]|uniref:RNA polymerase sigma-70 region 2 domain-containing protein n=1 Tax=Peribacillus asahii TaxID=228899 RepID=A0A3T0KT96_9BACI|nr:sigma factor [Peribacillus asahii]AZV43548.1 hypothetical protein BAOM_2939 [Peribacillus asahii]
MSPEELFEQNTKLVAITLKKMFKNPKAIAEKNKISYDDLLQYGYEALWESCLGYKSSKGKFNTYAINAIRNNIVRRLHLDCRAMKYDKKSKKCP